MGRGRRRSTRGVPEIKVIGVNAARALVERRIDDVIRVYLVEERLRDFSRLLEWCAQNRRAYHLTTADELDRVASSIHHEGICILARALAPPSLEEALGALAGRREPELVLALERVQNPNNLGAIVRSAAHFGVRLLVFQPADAEVVASTAIARTAEGGLEHVGLLPVEDLAPALRGMKQAGLPVIATSGHQGASIFGAPLPARAVLLLGAERDGLSPRLKRLADATVQIPGTGHVESLNVAGACAVLLAEHWRAHR